jgi:hypothetical protein
MRKLTFESLVTVGLIVAVAGPANAQATRTWVSGVGDDANPCSRTAPCKTFAGAISKTAAGGEINALDPGGFGVVTITKSITIDGGAGTAGVLATGTNGIIISAGPTDAVVLRNLDINGTGTPSTSDTRGIKFLSGKQLIVDNCRVYKFARRNISIESSTDGAQVLISNTIVALGANNGIVITPPASTTNHVVLSNVQMVTNAVWGLWSTAGGSVEVNNSVISHNIGGGLHADFSSVHIEQTLLSDNGIALQTLNSAQVSISNSVIARNSSAVSGTLYSFGNNQVRGNLGGDTLSAINVSRQ